MSAASHGHAHVVSLLRAVEGVDLDATNADGSSALLLGAQGKRTACVLALLGKAPPPETALKQCPRRKMPSLVICPATAAAAAQAHRRRRRRARSGMGS
jgi:hypothetical protein